MDLFFTDWKNIHSILSEKMKDLNSTQLEQSLDIKNFWRRQCQYTPGLLPREFHGQSSLAGCGPQCRKEVDTAE